MQIIIGTVDGKTHRSNFVTREEMIAAAGSEEKVVEILTKMVAVFKDFKDLTNVSLEQANGRTRVFNSANIVWWEIADLDEWGVEV